MLVPILVLILIALIVFVVSLSKKSTTSSSTIPTNPSTGTSTPTEIPGAVRVTVNPAYGVSVESVDGLGVASYKFYPVTVTSPYKSYTVSTSIPAGTVSVTTGAAPVTTAHISLYVDNNQVSCVNISAAGFYQLTLSNSVAVGSTVLVSVGGGTC